MQRLVAEQRAQGILPGPARATQTVLPAPSPALLKHVAMPAGPGPSIAGPGSGIAGRAGSDAAEFDEWWSAASRAGDAPPSRGPHDAPPRECAPAPHRAGLSASSADIRAPASAGPSLWARARSPACHRQSSSGARPGRPAAARRDFLADADAAPPSPRLPGPARRPELQGRSCEAAAAGPLGSPPGVPHAVRRGGAAPPLAQRPSDPAWPRPPLPPPAAAGAGGPGGAGAECGRGALEGWGRPAGAAADSLQVMAATARASRLRAGFQTAGRLPDCGPASRLRAGFQTARAFRLLAGFQTRESWPGAKNEG